MTCAVGETAIVAEFAGWEFGGFELGIWPPRADEELEIWILAVNFGFGAEVALVVFGNVGEFVSWCASEMCGWVLLCF